MTKAKCSVPKSDANGAKFFPFLYYTRERDLGDRQFTTQIHKIRDGLATLEASHLFLDSGYSYGGTILNIPKGVRDFLGPKARELTVPLSSSDVVFIPTRPPLDDHTANGRKTRPRRSILTSGTGLELTIIEKLRLVFKTCKRNEIILHEELHLGTADESIGIDYRAVTFQQYSGGTIEWLTGKTKRAPRENNLTLGYLVSISDVPPGGFRVIASFGAGGTETLWFNHLLRTVHRDCFGQALSKPGVHVWMLPFLVPDWAPMLLTCNPHELEPRVERNRMIEWTRL